MCRYGLTREEIAEAGKQLGELEASMIELAQAKPSSAPHTLRQLLGRPFAAFRLCTKARL